MSKDQDISEAVERMSWKQALLAWILPLVLQVICLAPIALIDPCRNNPGCIDGGVVSLSAMLLIPASAVFLLFIVLAERFEGVAFRRALKINAWMAGIPFLISYVWFFIH